jgi:UDP-glucose-4-epimerase GalE
MRVLVTGGAGYVGGFTARHLSASGHDVTVIDDLSAGHREAAPPGSLVVCDIADRARVAGLIAERRIEAVLHFAAFSSVADSVRRPDAYWRNNVAGTLALLEAMREGGALRFVFSSTAAVFGETTEMPLAESAALAPESPYATTKLAVERMLADFARAYGLRHVSLRYFNAAGASPDGAHGEQHDPETHLIPILLQALLGLRPGVTVYGSDFATPDGTCIRDYVHVADLAEAHVRALDWTARADAGAGEAINLGTGTGHSVLEVIRACERVTGLRVAYEIGARRPGDTARLVAGLARAERVLGWRPRAGLDEILASAWAWHRRRPRGYTDE